MIWALSTHSVGHSFPKPLYSLPIFCQIHEILPASKYSDLLRIPLHFQDRLDLISFRKNFLTLPPFPTWILSYPSCFPKLTSIIVVTTLYFNGLIMGSQKAKIIQFMATALVLNSFGDITGFIEWYEHPFRASLVAQMVKRLPIMWETRVRSLGWEDPWRGNGNPLQCSCLENPRDGGASWAAVYGAAQSQTRLKRLSSSSREIYGWLIIIVIT